MDRPIIFGFVVAVVVVVAAAAIVVVIVLKLCPFLPQDYEMHCLFYFPFQFVYTQVIKESSILFSTDVDRNKNDVACSLVGFVVIDPGNNG